MNPELPNCSRFHNIETEQKCLINLHNHNYLDATLCCLEDTKLPTFDCQYIEPKLQILLLFLKKIGIIQFKNCKQNKYKDTLIKVFFNTFQYCALYSVKSKEDTFIIMNVPYSEFEKYKTDDVAISLVKEKII